MIVKTENETYKNVKSLEMLAFEEEMDLFFHDDREHITIKVKDIIFIHDK